MRCIHDQLPAHLEVFSNDVRHLRPTGILQVDDHENLMYPSTSLLSAAIHEIGRHVFLHGNVVVDELINVDFSKESVNVEVAGAIVVNRVAVSRRS